MYSASHGHLTLSREDLGEAPSPHPAASTSICSITSRTASSDRSGGSNHPDDTATTETVQDTAAEANSAAEESPTDDAANESSEDGVGPFGEAYTWEDGLSVTIDKPKAYKPSDYAAGAEAGDAVSFKITLVNGTDEPFDPSMAMISAQSGNEEASEIFDSGKGLEGAPSTKLLAGRESTFTVGFSVADPDDIVVEFSPDFIHSSVLYSN